MVKEADIDKMQNSEEQLNVLREVFSMHIVLVFFTDKKRGNYQIEGKLNQIAEDNLFEIVDVAQKVLAHKRFRELTAQASNCSIERVRTAFDFEGNEKEQIVALNEIYRGLCEGLPKRRYIIEKSQADLAGYNDHDQFTALKV